VQTVNQSILRASPLPSLFLLASLMSQKRRWDLLRQVVEENLRASLLFVVQRLGAPPLRCRDCETSSENSI